jgi:glycine/D-amino acid oxidase-like deaminating enzyme
MDLRTNYPYWLLKDGIIHEYDSLNRDIRTEAVVIGAGITGALIAYHLVKAGIEVTVVDKRHVGMGSTAATTALLQYEIDEPLFKLIGLVGYKRAVSSYLLCYQSINAIDLIVKKEKYDADFRFRPSLQYASFKKHKKNIESEFAVRKKIGIPLELVDASFIKKKYGFHAEIGLLSQQAAEINAYKLTHEILTKNLTRGLRVFDRTDISVLTSGGMKIKGRSLIIACGYESQKYLPKPVEELSSTYAIISEPLDEKEFWYKNSLIWETAQPYLYIRTAPKGRILVGGKDDSFYNPSKRDRNLPVKAKQLQDSFSKLFPQIPFKTDFYWAGVFGSTKDSLPYIGAIPQLPHTWFALGFGGNGIIFSTLAAQIIRDELIGKKNPDRDLFSFNR